MNRSATLSLLLLLAMAATARGQIRVHPTGVNVNASGATTVFLTYGGLDGYVPVEAFWCGELIAAFPDVGMRCDPSTLFGSLPLRYDVSAASGASGFTDIMTIPPSVARRAYQAAEAGADGRFYYVRRFARGGAPEVYVAVTCRLAGGGARVPFALLDVRMAFARDEALLSVRPREAMPPLYAEIAYNGTGQLRGRWEIVLPGEAPPEARDLLTEATLPPAERARQRRYTELDRFSVFLPPSTRTVRLPGPDPSRLPADVEGLYQILLRIEAADDREGDSDLGSAGAGTGAVHSGAVAGFPIPPLRYYVGGASSPVRARTAGALHALQPADQAEIDPGAPIDFGWTAVAYAAGYALEIHDEAGRTVLSALVPAGVELYRAPPWLAERAVDGPLLWRVHAVDFAAHYISATAWRRLHRTTKP